jgi:hypothetical protein
MSAGHGVGACPDDVAELAFPDSNTWAVEGLRMSKGQEQGLAEWEGWVPGKAWACSHHSCHRRRTVRTEAGMSKASVPMTL